MIQPDKPTADRFLEKNFLTAHVEGSTRIEGAHGLGIRPHPPGYGPDYPREGEAKRRDKVRVPALHCALVRKANGDRYVTVTEGWVTEIIPRASAADGVTPLPIDNIWDGTHPNLLAEHGPIADGESVGVYYEVDELGNITPDPTIVVGGGSVIESTHYIPPVGDDTDGAAGDVFVELARYDGGSDSLVVLHEGNITHYHEIPSIVKVGGEHDIFKGVNAGTGVLETYGLTAGEGITLTKDTGGGSITFDVTGSGIDYNIVVYGWQDYHDVDGHLYYERDTTEEWAVAIRKGRLVAFYTTLAGLIADLGNDPIIPVQEFSRLKG